MRRFAQIRELTMSGIKTDAALQALREGHPSPEIVIKQFMGEDNVAVAVFIHRLSKNVSHRRVRRCQNRL